MADAQVTELQDGWLLIEMDDGKVLGPLRKADLLPLARAIMEWLEETA